MSKRYRVQIAVIHSYSLSATSPAQAEARAWHAFKEGDEGNPPPYAIHYHTKELPAYHTHALDSSLGRRVE